MEGLECKKLAEMSVTNTLFGRWELAAADDFYIINGNGYNIGGQTYSARDIKFYQCPYVQLCFPSNNLRLHFSKSFEIPMQSNLSIMNSSYNLNLYI